MELSLWIPLQSRGIIMKIQINTDHNISGGQELNRYIDSNLSEHFER